MSSKVEAKLCRPIKISLIGFGLLSDVRIKQLYNESVILMRNTINIPYFLKLHRISNNLQTIKILLRIYHIKFYCNSCLQENSSDRNTTIDCHKFSANTN